MRHLRQGMRSVRAWTVHTSRFSSSTPREGLMRRTLLGMRTSTIHACSMFSHIRHSTPPVPPLFTSGGPAQVALRAVRVVYAAVRVVHEAHDAGLHAAAR
mmetsp:Transcript_38121/g.112923  ORF Transcript_38121/g.112923 Transcript_38121/m.112923 type:complete len:100 (-) Transcript_38121:41-340(-)